MTKEQPANHMSKNEVLNLKAGSWVELCWKGMPNTVALLLEDPTTRGADVNVRCLHFSPNFDPEIHIGYDYTDHSHVVRSLGMINVPTLTPVDIT